MMAPTNYRLVHQQTAHLQTYSAWIFPGLCRMFIGVVFSDNVILVINIFFPKIPKVPFFYQ